MASKSITTKVNEPDWDHFVRILSKISDREARKAHFDLMEESHQKRLPDFRNLFTIKAREISFPEREEYYESENLIQSDIDLIEGMPGFVTINDDISNPKYFFTIDKLFGGLVKWANKNEKSLELTSIWLYSLGFEPISNTKLDYLDRLYLLRLLINGNVLDHHMYRGGKPLYSLLSYILDVPAASLKDPLLALKDFCKFDRFDKDLEKSSAKREKNRLDTIYKIILECSQVRQGPQPYKKTEFELIISNLDAVKKNYENIFNDGLYT